MSGQTHQQTPIVGVWVGGWVGGEWQNQRPTRKATYRLKVADAIEGQSEGTGARRDTAEDGKSRETNKKTKEGNRV